MNLPPYVKKQPAFWKYIPLLKDSAGNALYPFIFVREDIYNDLREDTPNPKYIATLLHEEIHRRRQIEFGWLKFGIKYLLFRNFRFQEELLGYKTTMREYKRNGILFDIEKIARFLSGPQYGWSASYTKAKSELEKAWNDA